MRSKRDQRRQSQLKSSVLPLLERRKKGFKALFILLVVAVVVLTSSVLGAQFLYQNATLVQLVLPEDSESESIFAEAESVPGTALGSPQNMVIFDQNAFLPGVGPDGERFVSDTYIKDKGIYPLQVKTVVFFRDAVAMAAAVAAILLLLLCQWWLRYTASLFWREHSNRLGF
jgi:hypothetical protein